jgi:hypothetical protein
LCFCALVSNVYLSLSFFFVCFPFNKFLTGFVVGFGSLSNSMKFVHGEKGIESAESAAQFLFRSELRLGIRIEFIQIISSFIRLMIVTLTIVKKQILMIS